MYVPSGNTSVGRSGNGAGSMERLAPVPRRSHDALLAEMWERRAHAAAGPGATATEQQHGLGKFTARERIERLLDKGSFREIDMLRRHQETGFGLERRRYYTDGVVTGWGTVDGRKVVVYATDFRILGGSLGQAHAAKVHKAMDLAISVGSPLIGLNDSAGARIQEGVAALVGYGGIFARNVRNSGVIPQISVMLGPCAGGASYSPALTDFVLMVRGTSTMFLTGPDVIKQVTGEQVTHEALGGAEMHGAVSGVASMVFDDEESCFEEVRELLSMLPSNNRETPPRERGVDPPDRVCPELLDIVPPEPNKPYDMYDVITEIVDDGYHLPVHESFAPNLICGFARLDGQVVGIVANQPLVMGGALDISASEKGARFVRTCDAFNIPLVSLVDVPGFLPGTEQEHGGIIRHGAKLLYAYCEATVPRIQVIIRKAYGGAYIVMDSRSIGCDLAYAWPGNEVAVMGAQGAVNVVFRKQIKESADPAATLAELADDYARQLMHPYYAAERGLVDDIIAPPDTRAILCAGLNMLESKHCSLPERKHANPPL